MWWIIGWILISGILILGIYASCRISAGIYLKAFCKGKTDEKIFAITFDDGPAPLYTAEVLRVLKTYQAPAAFFCIGEQAAKYPEIIHSIQKEGHTLGNHTYFHSALFPFYPLSRMTKDLQETEKIMHQITGSKLTLFRPPFGVTNPTVARVVRRLNYRTVGWSIRSFDTCSKSPGKVARRICKRLRPGAILLLHDRLPQAAELLTSVLEYAKKNGYRPVSLDKLF